MCQLSVQAANVLLPHGILFSGPHYLSCLHTDADFHKTAETLDF